MEFIAIAIVLLAGSLYSINRHRHAWNIVEAGEGQWSYETVIVQKCRLCGKVRTKKYKLRLTREMRKNLLAEQAEIDKLLSGL